MRLPRVALFLAVCVAAVGLSSCSVSVTASEEAECESRGGSVERDSFIIFENPGFFDPSQSGPLDYCEDPSGTIIDVYNEKIETLSDSWLLSDYNKDTWRNCENLGGETFKTSKNVGNSSSTRYVCIQDGRVVTMEIRR